MYVVRKPRNTGLYKSLPIFIVIFKLQLFHKAYANYPSLHRYSKVEKNFSHLPSLELEVTTTFKMEPVVHGYRVTSVVSDSLQPYGLGPTRLLCLGFSK